MQLNRKTLNLVFAATCFLIGVYHLKTTQNYLQITQSFAEQRDRCDFTVQFPHCLGGGEDDTDSNDVHGHGLDRSCDFNNF